MFAIGYMLANGTATFINKIVINLIPEPVSITFYTGLTAILSILIILSLTNNFDLLNINKLKNKEQVLAMESLEVIAMLLLRYAMIDGNIVIITAMTSSSIIIAIIMSNLIFKEKINLKKWLIILFIVIALVLLSIISI